MSHSRNAHKLSDKSRTDIPATDRNEDEGKSGGGWRDAARDLSSDPMYCLL